VLTESSFSFRRVTKTSSEL